MNKYVLSKIRQIESNQIKILSEMIYKQTKLYEMEHINKVIFVASNEIMKSKGRAHSSSKKVATYF